MAYSTTKILVDTTADDEAYTEGKVKTLTFQYEKSEVNGWIQNQLPRYSTVSSLSVEAQFKNVKNSVTAAKSATASISVNNSSVWSQTIDANDTWYTGSGSRALSNSVVSSPVVFKIDGPEYTNILGQTYHNALRIRQKKIIASYECPYFSVSVTGGTGGSVSGGGAKDITARDTNYTVSINATPSTNYHFVKWTFSGGASGTSSNASHSITYQDSTIGAHSKAITATATFAKNPRVYVKAVDMDTGSLLTGFLTGSDTATDKWYTIGATASRTASTTVANGDRSAVYEFAGWKIYKGNTSSGTATATSSNATYSSTFNSSDYSSGVCNSNGETTWVAQYRRLYFLEVTKSPVGLTYVVKNKTGTTLSSSDNGMDASRARYAIPSDGCTITMTVTNPRYGIKSSGTGVASNTYGTSTLNGTVLTVTPVAAQSTAIVNLVSEQLYWQLTISGNTGYSLNYDGVQQTNSYIAATGQTHVATIQYGQSGPLTDGTYLIPVDYSLSMLANDNTGYDATIMLDDNVVANRYLGVANNETQYTLGANTADHAITITTAPAYQNFWFEMVLEDTSYNVVGDQWATDYGALLFAGDAIVRTLRDGTQQVSVLRHGTMIVTYVPHAGYALYNTLYQAYGGNLWQNFGGANPCVINNVLNHFTIKTVIQYDQNAVYTVQVAPPRFGELYVLYLPDDLSQIQELSIDASRSSCTQFTPYKVMAAQLYIQALCTGAGVPYAFGCTVQRGSDTQCYRIGVASVHFAGADYKWIDAMPLSLPVDEDAVVTVYALYRKNSVDIPVDNGNVLSHVQPNDVYVDLGATVKQVREIYVDDGTGVPCCVWENADDNPCGLVEHPTCLSATDSSSPAGEKAANLFDGHYVSGDHTKWYAPMPADGTPLHVICDLGFARAINVYTLRTANDTRTNPERNPKSWRLSGSNNRSHWTVLHEVADDETLPAVNYGGRSFFVTNALAFRYYKLEILRTGGNEFQLAGWLLGRDLEPLPANGLRQS